ncbi:MAG: hypothetical protein N4A45_12250 [Flavobacteriales bacterium]|jgi:tetratricopeptide (TPR) repeat protein|nr:hypothetical protein [Flavobacteriales bacterium]
MAKFQEDNAITFRLKEMQKMWIKEICKKHQLVRWLVDKDEIRMVKAFVLAEASEHGKIEDLFIGFETPFEDPKKYGKALKEEFLTVWNSPEYRKEVEDYDVLPNWDSKPFEYPEEDKDGLFFAHCMASFAESIGKKTNIVLCLLPHAFYGNQLLGEWLENLVKKLPKNLKLMVMDAKDYSMFDFFRETKNSKTLEPNLDMSGAIRELIQNGDPHSPATGINLCILNLMEASKNKDLDAIKKWGEKGIRICRDMESKSMEATILLSYGSAYFQLKKYKIAIEKYALAEEISAKGRAEKDPTCDILNLQSKHFLAATYFVRKKRKISLEYYIQTAQKALEQENIMIYLEAQRQSIYISKKLWRSSEAQEIAKTAYYKGITLNKELLKFSPMLLITQSHYDFSKNENNQDEMKKIETFAIDIWGENWEDLSVKEGYQSVLEPEES